MKFKTGPNLHTPVPNGVIPMFNDSFMLFGEFAIAPFSEQAAQQALVAEVEIAGNERVALVFKRPGRDGLEVFRISIPAEYAKILGWHIERAGKYHNPEGVACGCQQCVAFYSFEDL